MHSDTENFGALVLRGVGRRGTVLIGGRWRVAIALRRPMLVRLRLRIFRRGESGATVTAAWGAGSAEARDRHRRKQDQKQQSETDSHDFRLHKILSIAPRGREGAPTICRCEKKCPEKIRQPLSRKGTCAGEAARSLG